jgi:uncharacterized protein (TIGR03083 family)
MTDTNPAAAGLDPLRSIRDDSSALIDAARDHLDVPIPTCPEWTMAGLVFHLQEVQYFWGDIVGNRLTSEDEVVSRGFPPDDELLDWLRDATNTMLANFAAADPSTPVWTWSSQKDVAFVIRHQVQEAAIHRWDAQNAIGQAEPIGQAAAVDSIEEFLTFTASYRSKDAADLPSPVLLQATDVDAAWIVSQDEEGDLRWRRSDVRESAPAVLYATASDLLLYLYKRVPANVLDVRGDVEAVEILGARNHTD